MRVRSQVACLPANRSHPVAATAVPSGFAAVIADAWGAWYGIAPELVASQALLESLKAEPQDDDVATAIRHAFTHARAAVAALPSANEWPQAATSALTLVARPGAIYVGWVGTCVGILQCPQRHESVAHNRMNQHPTASSSVVGHLPVKVLSTDEVEPTIVRWPLPPEGGRVLLMSSSVRRLLGSADLRSIDNLTTTLDELAQRERRTPADPPVTGPFAGVAYLLDFE